MTQGSKSISLPSANDRSPSIDMAVFVDGGFADADRMLTNFVAIMPLLKIDKK